jgi:Glycosyl transferase family 2
MNISVIIPAYNCAATIRATLDSVLRQTVAPSEILVMDDGSTDETKSILEGYGSRISVVSQANAGVGSALSALCGRVQGDLIAVLGSDDIWHRGYLEFQRSLVDAYPGAVAYFTGHIDFCGTEEYEWKSDPAASEYVVEEIPPTSFLKRYDAAPGPFACMSHCCIPKRILSTLGSEPFQLRMAEDLYFFNRLAPLGPVVYANLPLTAYRVRPNSLSANRLLLTESEVHAFELLQSYYDQLDQPELREIFSEAFATKRRMFAKVLLGAGDISSARKQLRESITHCSRPASVVKSLGLLLLSYFPDALQPAWPSSSRQHST